MAQRLQEEQLSMQYIPGKEKQFKGHVLEGVGDGVGLNEGVDDGVFEALGHGHPPGPP